MSEAISQSEIKRLRYLVGQDWPKTGDAIDLLRKRLDALEGKVNVELLLESSLEKALSDYRESVHQVHVVGKLEDPFRLAVFINSLIVSVLVRLQRDYGITCEPSGFTKNASTSFAEAKKSLYALFIEGAIRKTLRVSGYEQKILVDGNNNLLRSITGGSYFHTDGLGI